MQAVNQLQCKAIHVDAWRSEQQAMLRPSSAAPAGCRGAGGGVNGRPTRPRPNGAVEWLTRASMSSVRFPPASQKPTNIILYIPLLASCSWTLKDSRPTKVTLTEQTKHCLPQLSLLIAISIIFFSANLLSPSFMLEVASKLPDCKSILGPGTKSRVRVGRRGEST